MERGGGREGERERERWKGLNWEATTWYKEALEGRDGDRQGSDLQTPLPLLSSGYIQGNQIEELASFGLLILYLGHLWQPLAWPRGHWHGVSFDCAQWTGLCQCFPSLCRSSDLSRS